MSRKLREEDQIIEEIRAARAEVWREAGGTAADLARLLSDPRPPAAPRKPRPSRTPRPKRGRDSSPH